MQPEMLLIPYASRNEAVRPHQLVFWPRFQALYNSNYLDMYDGDHAVRITVSAISCTVEGIRREETILWNSAFTKTLGNLITC